jgi:predicted aconitase
LFHIVGITPEAPTLEAATGGRPVAEIVVDRDALRAARAELTTTSGEGLDMVVLGSPHFSLAEFRQLAPLLDGQRHPQVRFLVTTSRAVAHLARQAGLLEPLDAPGDRRYLYRPRRCSWRPRLMTNLKARLLRPGLLRTEVVRDWDRPARRKAEWSGTI